MIPMDFDTTGTDELDRDVLAKLSEHGLNITRREDGKWSVQAIDGPDEFGNYDLIAEWSLVRTA